METAKLVQGHGIISDAHAGKWHRQISFPATKSIRAAQEKSLHVTLGAYAENIATEGIDWINVPIGTQFRLGAEACVEITRIGKNCHRKCAIYHQAGDCIMPREGIFASVVNDGKK